MTKRPAIHYVLDECKEADSEWLKQQSQRNNDAIRGATVTFPSWQIVSQKWVRLQYQWATGEVTVVLEQHPNKRDTFTGLRMSRGQWDKLVTMMPAIQEYIRAAETGDSWDALALFRGHQITRATGAGAVSGGTQVRIRAFDMTFVTLTALDDWYQGGCQVDVRECVWDKDNGTKLIPIRNGLTLVGGGFDYLARFLVPRVNAGLRMYTEIYEHSSAFLESCYQRNTTVADNEKNPESDVDCMPEPFEYKEGGSHDVPSPHPSPYSKFY
jgi:hypothetical protein